MPCFLCSRLEHLAWVLAAYDHMALRVVQSLHGPSNSSLHLKDRDLTNPQAIPTSGETSHEKMVGMSLGPAINISRKPPVL